MRFILYILFILVLVSCKERPANNTQKLRMLNSSFVDLKGNNLDCDSLIASDKIVAYFDGHVVIRHFSDYIFTVYKLSENRSDITFVGKFGRRGNGPKEFFGIPQLYYNRDNNALYVFDIQGGNHVNVYQIDLFSTNNIFDESSWKSIDFPVFEHATFSSFVPLTDSIFLALGGDYDKANLLSAVQVGIKDYKALDMNYPDDGIKAAAIVKRGVYNYGGILKHPSANRFMYYCTNWGNYAEIIDNQDLALSSLHLVTADYPIYKVAQDGINMHSENYTLMGMRAQSSEKYIYFLPNFYTKEAYLKDDPNRSYPTDHLDKIYVYDWEGNPVKAYKLDKPLTEFIVDSNDTYLLGSSVDTESGDIVFVRFDLK